MKVVAVDLFCGAGGLTHGLERAGIDVAVGVDLDESCRYPYEANTRSNFLRRDIAAFGEEDSITDADPLDVDELRYHIPRDAISAVVGCAPCQPFSSMNTGGPDPDHEKWGLLRSLRSVVEELEPDLFAMENVPLLREASIYQEDFLPWLEASEYEVWQQIVDCTDYHVPQSRKRLVVLGSRLGEIEMVPPTLPGDGAVTFDEAFAEVDVTEIGAGESDPECHPLHKAAGLRGANPERMRETGEGEDWHDLPEELKPTSEASSKYTAYGRMWRDRPAPTLTTQFYNWGSGRFGHPHYSDDPEESVDRALSLYEGAILQTFPPDYEFVASEDDVGMNEMGRIIGNAIPARLAAAIGGSFRRHVEELRSSVEFEPEVKPGGQDLPVASYEELVPPPVPKRSPGHQVDESTRVATTPADD